MRGAEKRVNLKKKYSAWRGNAGKIIDFFLFRQFIVFMGVHKIAPGIFFPTKSCGKKL
jgi:hypothetical protein